MPESPESARLVAAHPQGIPAALIPDEPESPEVTEHDEHLRREYNAAVSNGLILRAKQIERRMGRDALRLRPASEVPNA